MLQQYSSSTKVSLLLACTVLFLLHKKLQLTSVGNPFNIFRIEWYFSIDPYLYQISGNKIWFFFSFYIFRYENVCNKGVYLIETFIFFLPVLTTWFSFYCIFIELLISGEEKEGPSGTVCRNAFWVGITSSSWILLSLWNDLWFPWNLHKFYLKILSTMADKPGVSRIQYSGFCSMDVLKCSGERLLFCSLCYVAAVQFCICKEIQ